MIRSINIYNFKCFERLEVESCNRINVIVGDNGVGKTALLEAIFFCLGSSPSLGIRFRQHRGLGGHFSGTARDIEAAIWRDYFTESDWLKREISIVLKGDGPENRELLVTRKSSNLIIPLETISESADQGSRQICFIWKDFKGVVHEVTPRIIDGNIEYAGVEEDVPDFTYFPANTLISASESAGRFSKLSRVGEEKEFIKIFTKEYKRLESLNVEVIMDQPVLFATVSGQKIKRPLTDISGGINRLVSIMLGIAFARKSIVLVDEIENGLYFKSHIEQWRSLLSLARNYDSQLFLSTHSGEWLEALVEAAGKKVDDISLWRIEETENGPYVRQFTGKQALAGMKFGEVR